MTIALLGKMPFGRRSRHFGTTNTPTTFKRCSRRTPGFEGFWLSYRTSSAETSFTQSNAVSFHKVRRQGFFCFNCFCPDEGTVKQGPFGNAHVHWADRVIMGVGGEPRRVILH